VRTGGAPEEGAFPVGGCAAVIVSTNRPSPDIEAMARPRAATSSSVTGRTQDAPAQAGSVIFRCFSLGEHLLHGAALTHPAEVQVAGEVRPGRRELAAGGRVGTEVPGPLAPQGHEPVGERAHLVGGLRPARTEAQIRVVLRENVRNAVFGVADDGGQAVAGGVLLCSLGSRGGGRG
jgi:hypothetical protein